MIVVSRSQVINEFKHEMDYAVKISPGTQIKVETNDCYFQQITQEDQVLVEIDYNLLNPSTGPIYIEGAMPGDLLKIKIIDIKVADKGVVAVVPNEGVLGDQVTKPIIRIVPIENGYGIFHGVKLPITPMIGVIGVAPALEDGNLRTDSAWKHGGNMDTTDIKVGSTLYLPVSQEGALLALGDCHAMMGDGEVSFTGLEVAAEVILLVDVIKGKTIQWPIVETNDYTMIIASGESTDDAFYEATSQAVLYLQKCLGLKWEEAYALASLSVDLKISQIVDPKKTVRAAIPKYVVDTSNIIESLE